MKTNLGLAALTVAGIAIGGLAGPSPSVAQDVITIASWGGAYSMSQRKAYYEPFAKETGITVLEDEWDGSLASIRAQVDTGNYKWAIVDSEPGTTIAGCDEGVLEVIDWSKLDRTPDDFLPGAALECGLGTISWSTIFTYNGDVYPGDSGPKNWADFWNIEKFPGRRGMYNSPIFNLEFALLADGVSVGDLYDVLKGDGGIDRAFAKLDEIKEHVIWWAAGALPPQLLNDGEVVMTTAWNGRIYNAVAAEGKNFVIVWDGQGMDYDFWVIPKGHPDVDLAYKFINYATQPERQGDQTNYISYGPLVKGADKYINADILPHLPTSPQNLRNYFKSDSQFWADHREELTERFQTWLTK